ncbi:MAG TPA: hypothetical protein VKU01_35610 [Bryobacteraceae bacterium]|nr:hypothetical protein [Bryobacteraceae bacterium]
MTRRTAIGLLTAPLFGATSSASVGKLFFLDLRGKRLLSVNTDGSNLRVVAEGLKSGPDGIAIHVAARQIFWTNMGKMKEDDGSIERVDFDGANRTTVVPVGGTFTAKQLKIDTKNGKLYWSDREGMRVMRANLDGSKIETLVETGRGDEARRDARNWCVGIAVDPKGRKIYWTQKGGDNAGQGSIRRAGIEIPKGEDAANRSDIEVLFEGLPEPIDLDLDVEGRMIYWTDRGDPPTGNSVSRARMDKLKQEIVVRDLHEGIGIALDVAGGRMYFTDLGGSVYSARLDGSDQKVLLSGQGALTGIAFAELPR